MTHDDTRSPVYRVGDRVRVWPGLRPEGRSYEATVLTEPFDWHLGPLVVRVRLDDGGSDVVVLPHVEHLPQVPPPTEPPRRYDQCDDTCTTDCGHCKGNGPPPTEPTPDAERVVVDHDPSDDRYDYPNSVARKWARESREFAAEVAALRARLAAIEARHAPVSGMGAAVAICREGCTDANADSVKHPCPTARLARGETLA